MGNSPLVSVIVTNYNYGEFVSQAVESTLAQSYHPIEVLVVDDGSTDGSRTVLRVFGGRIRLLEQENQGQAVALSAGVTAARGEILCFLDADDVWRPEKVERVVDTLGRHPEAQWLRHKLEVTDSRLQPLGVSVPAFRRSAAIAPCLYHATEGRISTATSALALRRDLADQVFPLPPHLASGDGGGRTTLFFDADALLIARASARGARGWSLDEVLGQYRRHERQQFTTRRDLERLLRRQVAVGRAIAAAVADETGVAIDPVSAHKHEAVLGALRGEGLLRGERRRAAVSGMRAALRMMTRAPGLAVRQAASLGMAYLAPGAWVRRLLSGQALQPRRDGRRRNRGRR